MKTVYEWLYEIGKDELVRLYAKYDTVHYKRIEDRELSLSEIDAFHRQRVEAYISDILNYEPREDIPLQAALLFEVFCVHHVGLLSAFFGLTIVRPFPRCFPRYYGLC